MDLFPSIYRFVRQLFTQCTLSSLLIIISFFVLNALSCTDSFVSKSQSSTEINSRCDSSLKEKIIALLRENVASREITADFLLQVHKRFLEDMDPEKLYLTEVDIDRYTNSSKQNEYLLEWNQNNFFSFEKMAEAMKQAIQRSRQYRFDYEKKLCRLSTPSEIIQSIEEAAHRSITRKKWADSLDVLRNNIEAKMSQDIYKQIADIHLPLVEKSFLSFIRDCFSSVEDRLQQVEKEWELLQIPSSTTSDIFEQKVIKAFISSFDAHSTVLNNEEAMDLKERLSKSIYGTGIDYSISYEDTLVVSKLMPHSPADQLRQIHPGDTIVSINGTPAKELIKVPQKLHELLGDAPKPDIITLVVSQNKNLKDDHKESRAVLNKEIIIRKGHFTSDKDRLDIRKCEVKNRGVVYVLTLHSFYASEDESVTSENDIKNALALIKKDLQQKKQILLGIILDLRKNRGGFLLQAVKVSGLFIRSGVIVVAKYANGEEKAFRDLDPHILYEGPFMVLTSKITASAAEVVAQALKDYKVALIVGDERTYGKGSIQMQTVTEEKESDNTDVKSYYKVTIGKYYSVSGHSPQLQGVKADVVVPSCWSNQKIGEEYLESALPNSGPIRERFHDTLVDVPLSEKNWMRRYYIPFLQKPKDQLSTCILELQHRSQQRLCENPIWEAFIRNDQKEVLRIAQMQRKGQLPEGIEEVIDEEQLQEATRIMSDLQELSKESAILH